ncbi:hypothetical protein GPALN_011553 [Globodera pallida]|nr:hypothetical protein GPALN_011553 [Globodera pallida]
MSYVVVPPLFYAAIVTKFVWMKVHNRSWNTEGAAASASDKDSARITWTCFAIQSVALCQVANNSANNMKWFNDFMLQPPPPTTTASESLKHKTLTVPMPMPTMEM